MDTDKLIAKYESGYQLLLDELKEIPKQAYSFKSHPKSWTIAEIIMHLADSEAHGFIRVKKIIAESGGKVCVYNPQIWADNLFYPEMNYKDALDLIRILRKNLVFVLKKTKSGDWNKYIYHPETGKITLVDLIQLYINHVDVHIKQIHQIFYSWKKAQKEEYDKDIFLTIWNMPNF